MGYKDRAGNIIKVILAGISAICLLTGCGKQVRTYQYQNQDTSSGVVITKAQYYEDELRLYVKGLNEEYQAKVYDADLKQMKGDFTFEYQNGIYKIKGKDASKISGLRLEGENRYYFRYLDSNAYAMVYEVFVCDIGYEMYGDEDAYYTDEEKAEQKAAVERRRAALEENYASLEGEWICERNPECYIKVYEKDGARQIEWKVQGYEDNAETEESMMYIGVVYFYDQDDGYQVEVRDDPNWGCSMRFDMNQDKTQITDFYYSNGDVYTKVKN